MKIGLMFLTYSNPIHTDIFSEKNYLNNDDCKIVIHPKYTDKLNDIWKKYISTRTIDFSWKDSNTIKAILYMIRDCYDDGCEKFCLCSEDSYPLVDFNSLENDSKDIPLSMFSPPESLRSLKTSPWFMINRIDAENILKSDDENDNLFNDIISEIKSDASSIDYFFLTLLNKLIENYQYTKKFVHYVEWFPNVKSNDPIIFNKLLPKNKSLIESNNSYFIRKTLPTFTTNIFKPKSKALILTIDNKTNSFDYDNLLSKIEDTHDLYIFLLTDDINNIDELLRNNCIQIFPITWEYVENGYKNLNTYFGGAYGSNSIVNINEEPIGSPVGFSRITNIKENEDPTTYKFQKDDVRIKKKINENEDKDKDDENENFGDVDEAVKNYYKLKKKYEELIKNKIIRTMASQKIKKKQFIDIGKPDCINCKQPVGTIFSRKYYYDYNGKYNVVVLTAKCGDVLNPCDLNIEIHKSARESYKTMIKYNTDRLNKKQMEIIKLKNNMLILGNTFKQDYLNKFYDLKENIQKISYELGTIKEENMIINNNPDLDDEIDSITYLLNQHDIYNYKEHIKSYMDNDNIDDLKSAINIYFDEIQPSMLRLRNMKYRQMYVDVDNDTKIKKLVQLKNTYHTENYYDDSVDEVVSFVEGFGIENLSLKKLKKENKTKDQSEDISRIINKSTTNKTIRRKVSSDLGKTRKKKVQINSDVFEEPETSEQVFGQVSEQASEKASEKAPEILEEEFKESSFVGPEQNFEENDDDDIIVVDEEGPPVIAPRSKKPSSTKKSNKPEKINIKPFGEKINLTEATEAIEEGKTT